MKKLLFPLFIGFLFAGSNCIAQDSSRLHFTTGVGVSKVTPALHHVLKPAIAFNSGVEIATKTNIFFQLTIDLNTLKYHQQLQDDASELLFQNTSSSILMLGLNGGKNFQLNKSWFISAYGGGGFFSIGEPRVMVKDNIVTQEIHRMSSPFGRLGSRLGKRTSIKFLQTIYLDVSWWATPLRVQGYKLNGFAFYLGTRMSVGN